MSAAFATRASSSMTARTASAAAHATGLPPNVLNSSTSSGTASITPDRTTRAATGKPLPIGLPITTMSGSIPEAWKLHRPVPNRP